MHVFSHKHTRISHYTNSLELFACVWLIGQAEYVVHSDCNIVIISVWAALLQFLLFMIYLFLAYVMHQVNNQYQPITVNICTTCLVDHTCFKIKPNFQNGQNVNIYEVHI